MPTEARDLAPQVTVVDCLAIGGVTSAAIAGTGVWYSKYFRLRKNSIFGILLKLSSSGAIDVKVELEVGNTIPTDSAVDSAGLWAVGDVISAGLVTAGPHALPVTPTVAKWGRLKVTGQGANHASTALILAQIGEAKAYG